MSDVELLQRILTEWAIEFIRTQRANVQKSKIVAKEDLIRSFESSLAKVTADGIATVFMTFNTSGRYQDLKRLRHQGDSVGEDGLEEIKKWIKEVGVNKFLPGFRRKRGNRTPKNINSLLNDIAWGVSRAKTRKHKRKKWYSNGREESYQDLIERLATGYSTLSLDELKKTLANGN